jgi:hypothetical protein
MRKPSSGAGWWLAATKSFGIAPRSRTGCIPFFRRILSRRAHMPTCSAGWVGTGSDDRNCQPMSGPQSTGICASSIGWARISQFSTARSPSGWIEDPSVKRLLTITGININVAAGLVAAIGDVRRFSSPQKLVSYVGLNPRVRQSGLGLAQHGRISKRGRSHARAMLVEAAWAAAKAPGPLRSFFLRIRARRGHQIAAVAVARKLAVLCWHLLTKDADYQWARPALVAHKIRAMQLQAGQPEKKGNKRGAAYAYNIKELRDREIDVARHAEHAYEQFVGRWQAWSW